MGDHDIIKNEKDCTKLTLNLNEWQDISSVSVTNDNIKAVKNFQNLARDFGLSTAGLAIAFLEYNIFCLPFLVLLGKWSTKWICHSVQC